MAEELAVSRELVAKIRRQLIESRQIPNLPADYESRLAKNDLTWMAKNRERVIKEWSRRYGSTQ